MYVVLNMAGADQRQDDLFSTESLLAKGRSALKGLKVIQFQDTLSSVAHFDAYLGSRERIYAAHASLKSNPGEPL